MSSRRLSLIWLIRLCTDYKKVGDYMKQECYSFIVNMEGHLFLNETEIALIRNAWEDFAVVGYDYGSAYNMAVYLIGEIKECRCDNVIVTVIDIDDLKMPVKIIAGKEQMEALMDALDEDLNGDSWEIATKVWSEIKEKELEGL